MSGLLRQLKYRKSASISHLKSNPESIQFNPKQFFVGQSKIQRLSSRLEKRRNSLTVLPKTQKTQKIFKGTVDNDLQIQLMKSINQKLSKQNKQLRQQIHNYQSQIKSLKKVQFLDQVTSKPNTIMNQKVNKTKCSSKVLNSDNQTLLHSSKQLSYGQFYSIKQMFETFIKRASKPSFSQFNQQLNNFFQVLEQNYIKLKLIFQSLEKSNQKQLKQYDKCSFLLKNLNQICQFKVRATKYQQQSQIKKCNKIIKEQNTKEQCLELMSTQQIIERFQKYILKILRSQKMLKTLKINIVVRKFITKLNQL